MPDITGVDGREDSLWIRMGQEPTYLVVVEDDDDDDESLENIISCL